MSLKIDSSTAYPLPQINYGALPPSSGKDKFVEVAPPVATPAIQPVKKPSLLSSFFNWFKKLFGGGKEVTEKEEAPTPIETDRLLDQIEQTARNESYRKDLFDEEFSERALATEFGIEKAYLKLLLADIELKNDQVVLEETELLAVHKAIQATQKKIEERMKKQMENMSNSIFLGNIEATTAALFVAGGLVIFALGIISGGTLPAIAVGIMTATQVVASLARGTVIIAQSCYKKEYGKDKAGLLGERTARKHNLDLTKDLMGNLQASNESVTNNYQHAREVEKARTKVIKGVLR